MAEKWIVQTKKADFKALAERFNIDPVIARLIRNRGAETEEDFDFYLNGTAENMYDPALMKDLPEACEIIMKAIGCGEKIRIIGDYDVDGVSSTYILFKGLKRLGAEVSWDIPDRIKDGYGINDRLVEQAANDGISLILTCDNGISAASALEHAYELGLKVVVSDHHSIPQEDGADKLPRAEAVVNPHRKDCGYPFEEICGAVVAFKIVTYLYRKNGIAESELEEFLELAALATVADVMDLISENRVIVREGLKLMKNTKNLGLSHLMQVNGLDRNKISSYSLGFVLGPSINAAGRVSTAHKAMELLLAEDIVSAEHAAMQLKTFNIDRKAMTADGVEQAIDMIESSDLKNDNVLVVYMPGVHESLAGIIAGKIKEKYTRPTFVITKGEGCVKGSGRSIPAYSMYEKLSEVSDLLKKFGGHPMAAGLSLAEEDLDEFRHRLNENANLTANDLTEEVLIDMPVPLYYLNERLIDQLQLLEPTGNGNPEVLFAEQHVDIVSLKVVGKDQNTMKMKVRDQRGAIVNAIMFWGAKDMLKFLEDEYGLEAVERTMRGRGDGLDIAITYKPAINEWRGVKSVEINVTHYCKIRK